MSSANSLLVGAVLSLSDASGEQLELRVTLARSATVAVVWGAQRFTSTVAAAQHRFGPWPIPRSSRQSWRLDGPDGLLAAASVQDFDERPLRVAVYGAPGGGQGPHVELMRKMARWRPHVVFEMGSRNAKSANELRAVQPVSAAAAFHSFSPGAAGAWPLHIGPAVFIGLSESASTNRPLRFLSEVASRRPLSFVLIDWAPLSSGLRGGHPRASALLEAFVQNGITAVLSGHDRIYERFGRDRTTLVVTGGGGAPLERQHRVVRGSSGVVASYHWVALELFETHAQLEARSLDGLVLDRAHLPPKQPARYAGRVEGIVISLAIFILTLALALARLLKSGSSWHR